ncbi:hypothetical protein Tco_0553652 [Tanacetum coccineum]
MLCKPKPFYDEKKKVAIGYKNPLCLTRAKQVQSALYNGHELVMTNHARPVVHDSEDTRDITEITRKRMMEKIKSPLRVENKVRIAPQDYSKENLLATFALQRDLTPEQIFWSIDENDRKKAETSVPKPLSALTVYPPNTHVKLVPKVLPTKSQVKINLYVLTQLFTEFDKTCKKRITPTGVTEGEREVKVMEEIFDQMNDEVDQNIMDKQCAEIVKKNLLIENENLIANCLSNQLLYDVEKSRYLDLEAEMSKIKNLEHQIQEKDNVIRDLKVLVSNVNDRSCEPYNANDVTDLLEQNKRFRAEIEKVKQHYKELYDSIKITRAHTSEKTSIMLNEIESLEAQLKSKVSCVTSDSIKPKVLAPGMYAIDVKSIPPPLKNNRSAHLNYINHLKESVEIVREIVEEARVVKPLDNALNYACQYTKLSQELLEYVIGTCPISFNERDNKAASTPLTRKKQVTFNDTCKTSTSDIQKHVVQQKVQQSNVPVIPSTRVSSSTKASRSKLRSNTKKYRILPAKSENKKKVEEHLRTIKYVWTKVNRVDFSISSKRVVINSNSESVCKTCNKCLIYSNRDICVVKSLNYVNATPTVKNDLNKAKQVWKAKGKLCSNGLNKANQVWKATGKLFANVGYQWRPIGKKFTFRKYTGGYQWRPIGKIFPLGEQCPLTRLSVTYTTISANQQDPNRNWGSEIPNSPPATVFKCRPCSLSKWRLLASLQAPFLKEKKGVRFSALYLQKKRNLLVFDHSHQQVSYFSMLLQSSFIESERLQIGKGNLLLDLQKLQKNPIFRISVDIRQNTNFVRAFTTSANVPSIYIQLFWNTLTHDAKTRVYSFQVDKHWLTLSVDLLRKALDVTPADSAHPFESPPAASQDETIGHFVHPKDATSIKMVGSNSKQSHVALAGPNPEHMHDVFLATNYPKVHESLKHTSKEHVHLENPPSSSRTLSSMKNLEDNFTFGDQVINDKSQEGELGKTTMESEVESMVIVPIQQDFSSAPPLNTPVIDLSSPKLVSPSCQEPFITTSTTNTRTITEQNRS